jgi:hypothetical protein
MDFSGGISAFVLPMMRRQSPDVTAFTLPLSHPDAPVLDAMIAAYTLPSNRDETLISECSFVVSYK